MIVQAANLSDADRDLIVEANRAHRLILVAATEAMIVDLLAPGGSRGADQYVGVPQSWGRELLTIGSLSGSYSTTIPWAAIRGVWLLDAAPPESEVEELL